jgi:hypothetical protein
MTIYIDHRNGVDDEDMFKTHNVLAWLFVGFSLVVLAISSLRDNVESTGYVKKGVVCHEMS